MSDSWQPRLSEYLDGELGSEEAHLLETHLERCAECREELESLRLVVGRLDSAPDREPARDLWPELERRMEREAATEERQVPRRAGSFSALRFAAALAGMMVLGASAWFWLADRDGGEPLSEAAAKGTSSEASGAYAQAAEAWRDLLAQSELPSELADPLRSEMAAFERAIEETRQALADDPSDPDLRAHLAQTLRAQMRFMARAEEWTGGRS